MMLLSGKRQRSNLQKKEIRFSLRDYRNKEEFMEESYYAIGDVVALNSS